MLQPHITCTCRVGLDHSTDVLGMSSLREETSAASGSLWSFLSLVSNSL